MKDKEWLKEEIEKIDVETSENFPHYDVISKNIVLYLINQLDEAETLSQKRIDDNIFEVDSWNKVVNVNLQNLLVPKQEETTEEAHEKYGMSETRWKEVIERYKWHLEQEGYAVIEKPAIPQFVADWIEGNKQLEEKWNGYSKEDAMKDTIHFTIYGLFADYPVTNRKSVNNWLDVDRGNYFKLVNAVRYGYEVEKEQKYYVLDSEDIPLLRKVIKGFGIDDRQGKIVSSTKPGEASDVRLTEQEIKDYDERYWAFAVPVEEEEE